MRIVNLIIYLFSLSLYGETLLVLDMQKSKRDADIEVNRIKKEISNTTNNLTKRENIPKVMSIKVGERWIIVSDTKDKNATNRMSIRLRREYPSALIIANRVENKISTDRDVAEGSSGNSLQFKWIILILIGIFGLVGIFFILQRASSLKKLQDDLEDKQQDLMKNIIKSEKYV